MVLQEKFDDIIDCIEYLVSIGTDDIPTELAKETGLNLRLLGDAFQFITDITLIKYIRQRRLIRAITNRIKNNLSVEEIAAGINFSDAAAFSKACKQEFGLTPIQFTEDRLKEYHPLYFDKVISGGVVDYMENNMMATRENNICGVSAEQFSAIKQVLELSAIYGFSDEETEFVYRFAKECSITVAEAAEFCEEAKIQEEYDLSSNEIQQVLCEIRCNGYAHIYELPEGFFTVYFSEENDKHGWYVPYICEITKALNENGISASSLSDVVFHAETFGIDIVEAIERFEEFEKEWDDLISDVTENGIPENDIDQFGYRSIWEFDEE